MIQILSRNSLGINFFEDLAYSPRVLFHYLNSYLSSFIILVYILKPLQVLPRYRWARRQVALHSVKFLSRVRVQLVYSVVQVFGRCVECRKMQVQIVDFVNYSAVGSWLTRFLFVLKKHSENLKLVWAYLHCREDLLYLRITNVEIFQRVDNFQVLGREVVVHHSRICLQFYFFRENCWVYFCQPLFKNTKFKGS